jgi:hypothetical protein
MPRKLSSTQLQVLDDADFTPDGVAKARLVERANPRDERQVRLLPAGKVALAASKAPKAPQRPKKSSSPKQTWPRSRPAQGRSGAIEWWYEGGSGLLDAGWYAADDEHTRQGPFEDQALAVNAVRALRGEDPLASYHPSLKRPKGKPAPADWATRKSKRPPWAMCGCGHASREHEHGTGACGHLKGSKFCPCSRFGQPRPAVPPGVRATHWHPTTCGKACSRCKQPFAAGHAVVIRGKKHLCMPCAMKSGSATGTVLKYVGNGRCAP